MSTTTFSVTTTLPLARTDVDQPFTGNVFLNGDYNRVGGRFLDFHRPNVTTDSGVRFFRDDDQEVAPGVPHFCEIGMDMAVGGYYLAIYDNRLDFVQLGIDGAYAGRIAVGHDPIVPDTQLSIHDLPGITKSIAFWSNGTSLWVNSKALSTDAIVIDRAGGEMQHWLNWHQGDGSHDWRLGMMSNTYDLGLYAGGTAVSPSAQVMTFSPSAVRVNVPLIAKEITDLQAQVAALQAQVNHLSALFKAQPNT